MDRAIAVEEKVAYYERLGRSLHQLDTEGVEIIPQTMAPFPWHFGGQRHQNLFVLPEEITSWCRQLNLRSKRPFNE
jgi:N-acetylneuraminate synthase